MQRVEFLNPDGTPTGNFGTVLTTDKTGSVIESDLGITAVHPFHAFKQVGDNNNSLEEELKEAPLPPANETTTDLGGEQYHIPGINIADIGAGFEMLQDGIFSSVKERIENDDTVAEKIVDKTTTKVLDKLVSEDFMRQYFDRIQEIIDTDAAFVKRFVEFYQKNLPLLAGAVETESTVPKKRGTRTKKPTQK
jgi:hypothetical protein